MNWQKLAVNECYFAEMICYVLLSIILGMISKDNLNHRDFIKLKALSIITPIWWHSINEIHIGLYRTQYDGTL